MEQSLCGGISLVVLIWRTTRRLIVFQRSILITLRSTMLTVQRLIYKWSRSAAQLLHRRTDRQPVAIITLLALASRELGLLTKFPNRNRKYCHAIYYAAVTYNSALYTGWVGKVSFKTAHPLPKCSNKSESYFPDSPRAVLKVTLFRSARSRKMLMHWLSIRLVWRGWFVTLNINLVHAWNEWLIDNCPWLQQFSVTMFHKHMTIAQKTRLLR